MTFSFAACNASWALQETLRISALKETNYALPLYATLLHNFGANDFIQSSVAGGGQSHAAYKQAWKKTVHYNMDYYFNDILRVNTGTSETAKSYPVFVPVSSVYQTGRSFINDGEKKYVKTMQPTKSKTMNPSS